MKNDNKNSNQNSSKNSNKWPSDKTAQSTPSAATQLLAAGPAATASAASSASQRRRLFCAGVGAGVVGWTKPASETILLPAHAQTSELVPDPSASPSPTPSSTPPPSVVPDGQPSGNAPSTPAPLAPNTYTLVLVNRGFPLTVTTEPINNNLLELRVRLVNYQYDAAVYALDNPDQNQYGAPNADTVTIVNPNYDPQSRIWLRRDNQTVPLFVEQFSFSTQISVGFRNYYDSLTIADIPCTQIITIGTLSKEFVELPRFFRHEVCDQTINILVESSGISFPPSD